MSARTKGLGNVDETELKKELTNYFGAEGTGFEIDGDSSEGWTVSILNLTESLNYQITSKGAVAKEQPIDNSQSLVLGLVDDLGTRSTIYLYNNKDKITDGTITITLPDSSTGTITAIPDTSEISDTANYYAYTVSKNGTYEFEATDGNETTTTTIKVSNIEKFKKIDDLGLSYVNSDNKAYSYKGAAVPKGYYVDTKSEVNTGLVVTDAVDSEGYSTGNEWVWVPVNSTVGNDDYYKLATGNMYGATSVSYTKYSKLYSFLDKTRESYGTFHPYGTTTGTLSIPADNDNYREPTVLVGSGTEYDAANITSITNRQTKTLFTSSNTITDVATQYREDCDNMVESVDNYHGFYIGRYEITANGEKPGDSLTNTNWYQFYNQCITLGKTNTESGMIYGCLWDATMQWLAESNISVGYTGNNTSGYGNYINETINVRDTSTVINIEHTKEVFVGWGYQTNGKQLQTGQVSYIRSNNIYDLAGNCMEWTQEAYSTSNRVVRGRRLHE